jgi:hypothetical protein
MKKTVKVAFLTTAVILTILLIGSCKNKDASALKIYIRSSSNELVPDAQVVIIGDVKSNPPTKSYVDTAFTNSSGFATFDMQPYFDMAGEKENPVGYFDIIYKNASKQGSGRVRCRVHITAVETLYFPN